MTLRFLPYASRHTAMSSEFPQSRSPSPSPSPTKVTQGRGGGDLQKQNKKHTGGKCSRGDLPQRTTQTTHTNQLPISEKHFKRHKDSSWGSLRLASVSCDDTSSANDGKETGTEVPSTLIHAPRHHGAHWPMLVRDPPKACSVGV